MLKQKTLAHFRAKRPANRLHPALPKLWEGERKATARLEAGNHIAQPR